MTPRTGRPKKENARNVKVDTRLSEEEEKKLNYCCEALSMTKAEVVRIGIDKVYNELKPKEKE